MNLLAGHSQMSEHDSVDDSSNKIRGRSVVAMTNLEENNLAFSDGLETESHRVSNVPSRHVIQT
jgi:hypothetical protein